MSEKGPFLSSARTPERDGPEKEDHPGIKDPSALRRHVATEIGRHFPGINHDGILKQAANITRDLAGAQDVRQGVYLGLLSLSDTQRANIRSLDAYISVSVCNLAVRWRDTYRSPNAVCLDAAFNEKRIEDFTARIADEDEINFMLKKLPKNCREGFVYYFGEDCTAEEVATRLGIKAATFKKRLQRAMVKLAAARLVYVKRRKR